jgi:hypothetical protein
MPFRIYLYKNPIFNFLLYDAQRIKIVAFGFCKKATKVQIIRDKGKKIYFHFSPDVFCSFDECTGDAD